jgi:hypothetical protein
MTTKVRTRIIRWTVLALTIVAFGGSYRHGVEWVDQHTTGEGPGFWEWVTAALPEVMVIVAVLSYPDRPRDPRVWFTGTSAVAWTLWANGASAGPGLSGLVVAMWPAWAALTALALMGHPGKLTPEPIIAVPEPVKPQVIDLDQETDDEAKARRKQSRHARRTRERLAQVEDVDRLRVFERDEWTCHICAGPVDRELPNSDPMGPTLDHVVPLSAGGLHSYKNVKLAHRRCNESKGGPPVGPRRARGPVSRSDGLAWALDHDQVPSSVQIMEYMDTSLSTAKRVRKLAQDRRARAGMAGMANQAGTHE